LILFKRNYNHKSADIPFKFARFLAEVDFMVLT
jgi:hypothetical protein